MGRVPSYPFATLAARNVNVRNVLVYSMSETAKRAAIEGIAQWTAVGNATFAISHRFPLA